MLWWFDIDFTQYLMENWLLLKLLDEVIFHCHCLSYIGFDICGKRKYWKFFICSWTWKCFKRLLWIVFNFLSYWAYGLEATLLHQTINIWFKITNTDATKSVHFPSQTSEHTMEIKFYPWKTCTFIFSHSIYKRW